MAEWSSVEQEVLDQIKTRDDVGRAAAKLRGRTDSARIPALALAYIESADTDELSPYDDHVRGRLLHFAGAVLDKFGGTLMTCGACERPLPVMSMDPSEMAGVMSRHAPKCFAKE
jgi:hypothetical protein